MNQTKFDVQW